MNWQRLALSLLLPSCASDTDIVATSFPGSDEKAPKPSSEAVPGPGLKSEPVECTQAARDLVLFDKTGTVLRVSADTLDIVELETPTCLTGTIVAAALDHTGRLWAVTHDRRAWQVDLDTGACAETKLGAAVSALAFGRAPRSADEQLYVADADQLYEVDPRSLERRLLRPLQTRLLTGTGAGQLLALVGDSDATFVGIRLEDAQPTDKWQAKVPDGSYLSAGAAWGADLTLVFSSDLYSYSRDTGEQAFLTSLPATRGVIIAAASSFCATLKK